MSAPHILVVAYPAQGHIAPARHLALRLLGTTAAHITFSTAVSAHRRMFPDAGEVNSAGVHYVPYSDDGYDEATVLDHKYVAHLRLVGPRALAALLGSLRDAGRPVTRVVYTALLSWVGGVARDNGGIPSVVYWIQSATVLASYFHVIHGTDGVDKAIAAAAAASGGSVTPIHVPGIQAPLLLRDLPSFLLSEEDPYYGIVRTALGEIFDGEHRPTLLANTLDAMEPEAVATLRQHGLEVVPVGPVLSQAADNKNDLFKQDGKDYLAWLNERAAGSVVYISFGSMSVMSARQIAEVERGMAESGRPFLWVLRKDNPWKTGGNGNGNGMVVEWCDQWKVLSHPAVGCFVTHCGWNSTLESLACGVPVVAVPQWTDQGTNAWLMEQLGTGVRAVVKDDDDGVLEASELQRCVGLATSEMARANAEAWRDKARAARGSADLNLTAALALNVAPTNWLDPSTHTHIHTPPAASIPLII